MIEFVLLGVEMEIEIDEAIKLLKLGEVIIVPTDTVYGFVCLEENKDKIYDMKNRPKNKELIKLVNKVEKCLDIDEFSLDEIKEIASEYWPGSNTLIFKKNNKFISYRIPNEINLLKLLSNFDDNIVSTSANISGKKPLLTYEEISKTFPDIKVLKKNHKTIMSNEPSKIFKIKKNSIERIR